MSDFNDKDKELMTQLTVLVGGSVVVGFLLLASKGMEWSNNAYEELKAQDTAAEIAMEESQKQNLIENTRRFISFHSQQMQVAQDMPQHDDPRKLYDLAIVATIDAPRSSPLFWDAMQVAGLLVKQKVLENYQIMGVVDVDQGRYMPDTGDTEVVIRARIQGDRAEIEPHITRRFSTLQQKQTGEGMMLPEEPAPAIAPQDTAVTGGKGPTPAR